MLLGWLNTRIKMEEEINLAGIELWGTRVDGRIILNGL
jgi:hypothetical protein